MTKKRKKTAVPKRIAGVKVPKPVRRGLRRLADSQDGKRVIAEALLAAGAALVAHQAQPGSESRRLATGAAKKMKGKASTASAATAFRAGALASAFGQATQAFAAALSREAAAPTQADPPAPGPAH